MANVMPTIVVIILIMRIPLEHDKDDENYADGEGDEDLHEVDDDSEGFWSSWSPLVGVDLKNWEDDDEDNDEDDEDNDNDDEDNDIDDEDNDDDDVDDEEERGRGRTGRCSAHRSLATKR